MAGYSRYTKKERLRKRLTFQYNKGDYAGAARLGEALLRAHQREYTTNSPDYAKDMYNVAVAASAAGHINRAIDLYTEYIKRIQLYPQEELSKAAGLTNLAALLSGQGKQGAACRLFYQAFEIKKRLLPPGHPDLAESHYNLLRAQGGIIKFGIFYCVADTND